MPSAPFIAYFQLVEACQRPGCPVCRCVHELTLRSLDALLYEQVTDPTTRGALDQSWGLCAAHSQVARGAPNAALGLAIIYQGLLGRARARLSTTRKAPGAAPVFRGWHSWRGWRRLLRSPRVTDLAQAWAGRARCPMCITLAGAEAGYVRAALDALDQPEFDAAYARSTGLCLPHVALALGRFPEHRGAATLMTRALPKLDRLAEDLRRFIDKHDHRSEASFTEAEAASWAEAVAFFAGSTPESRWKGEVRACDSS